MENFADLFKTNTSIPFEKEFEVSGVKLILGMPTNSDEFIISKKAEEASNSPILGSTEFYAALQDFRIKTLACMIISINGIRIPETFTLDDGTKIEKSIKLVEDIRKWPMAVILSVYYAATDFKKQCKKEIRSSVKYDWYGEDLLKKEAEEEKQSLTIEEIEEKLKDSKEALKVVEEGSDESNDSSFQNPEDKEAIEESVAESNDNVVLEKGSST
jgi:hypothetical protein